MENLEIFLDYIGEDGYVYRYNYDSKKYYNTGISLKGNNGNPGRPGRDGKTPYIGSNGHWFIGEIDTGYVATGSGGGSQVQSDWNQTDNTADDFIKNKPTIPVIPSNTAYLSSDSGEGIVPTDGIRAETVNSGATISVNPDVVTLVDGAVGTAAITLQVPNDNLAHVWDIFMTTDSTVAVTIAMSNSATIKSPSSFAVAASKDVEICVIGKGSKYYLRYGEFA